MRKLIWILLLGFLMSSCIIGDDTIYNYLGSVVVGKYTVPRDLSGSCTYYVKLRIEDKSKLRKYVIEKVQIPKFEYDQIELGDTIK